MVRSLSSSFTPPADWVLQAWVLAGNQAGNQSRVARPSELRRGAAS